MRASAVMLGSVVHISGVKRSKNVHCAQWSALSTNSAGCIHRASNAAMSAAVTVAPLEIVTGKEVDGEAAVGFEHCARQRVMQAEKVLPAALPHVCSQLRACSTVH